jgi:hypothetical protein
MILKPGRELPQLLNQFTRRNDGAASNDSGNLSEGHSVRSTFAIFRSFSGAMSAHSYDHEDAITKTRSRRRDREDDLRI